MAAKSCAFVTFTARAAAEKAAEEMAHKLIVKATRLKVMWGKPREARPGAGGGAGPSDAMQPSSSGRPGAGAPPMMAAAAAPGFFNLPPPGAPGAVPYYPSMDPSMYGSRPPPRHADEAPGEGPEAKRQRMGPRPPPGPPPASAMAAPGTT